jgi:hypothetical protein
VDRGDDRHPSDELGDQPVLHQVLGEDPLEGLAGVLLGRRGDLGVKADPMVSDPLLDHLLELSEGAAADEEDVRGVDREELLVGVLAPALGRHRRGGSLEDLQQRLLDPLA